MADQGLVPGTPSPLLVAEWLKLDVLVDPGRVPLWAAHWIVDGLDTPALRDLAGLDGRPYEVRDTTSLALDQMNVSVESLSEAAKLALIDEAERCLAGLRECLGDEPHLERRRTPCTHYHHHGTTRRRVGVVSSHGTGR
jgi:hypothetical protein